MNTNTTTAQVADIHLRVRRLETRMTKFMEAQGFDTGCLRARWLGDSVVEVPTPACSLKEIMSLIPADWSLDRGVRVVHHGKVICVLLPC